MTTETAKFTPQDVDDLTMAFPASVKHLMPTREEIPEDFLRGRTKWNDLVGHWFFRGLEGAEFTPRDGIDQAKALSHIKTVLGSFEPKHEHKEAAVAYLLSLWFKRVKYAKGEAR